MKTTVIHHSADFDGIFCREIARKYLPTAELIGWDFKDKPLPIPDGQIYILDLPVDRVFGLTEAPSSKIRYSASGIFEEQFAKRIIWIDHHKSSIETHPTDIPGYRIDGVAACRLCWQWFSASDADRATNALPIKEPFVDRRVSEPLAVRLAGEYDVWDHRGDGDLEFQFGLDAQVGLDLQALLTDSETLEADTITRHIVDEGAAAMRCYAKRDADVIRERSFICEWKGLKFLTLNTARCNSNTFAAKDVPETGHDALMAFYYDGRRWNVSLYHAKHHTNLDLSLIAAKHGGGGHRGACGFQTNKLPFLP